MDVFDTSLDTGSTTWFINSSNTISLNTSAWQLYFGDLPMIVCLDLCVQWNYWMGQSFPVLYNIQTYGGSIQIYPEDPDSVSYVFPVVTEDYSESATLTVGNAQTMRWWAYADKTHKVIPCPRVALSQWNQGSSSYPEILKQGTYMTITVMPPMQLPQV